MMNARAKSRLAAALWLVFAFTVWNVVFDRVLVLAGRHYVADAQTAMHAGQHYLRIDDVMRPALRRAVRLASYTALPLLAIGLLAVQAAARFDQRSTSSKNETARASRD